MHEKPPLPGRKRPQAELRVFGRFEAVFSPNRNAGSVHSPGGLWTLTHIVVPLTGRWPKGQADRAQRASQ